MDSLSNKIAIVTGGSRGIGFAVARALLAEGVRVSITGRRAGDLEAARRKLESSAGALETFNADSAGSIFSSTTPVWVFSRPLPTCRHSSGRTSSTPI
jgi:NAD(P)-dependent dehydrogenase (short-subunit alcohol dehydrogenase family)